MIATDSLKTLAVRYSLTVAQVREIAADLQIPMSYAKARRSWVLNADAATVVRFNRHLAGE